ncbi:MAG: endonuclease, partial [Bacteroidaceae bacterium]|nr:endonuclease [Bacteroidaceae bacterium]
MSWNVENLFDCHDDPLKDDGEFLPESERRWTPARYWRKQDQLARTIAAVEPQNGWPLLVGMMEVENDSVLFDLTRRSPLRRAGYDFLVTQSPDIRGIDVALLYQPKVFR